MSLVNKFFFMQLFYLDNVSPTFDGPSNAMRAIPRLNYWGDDQLRETVRLFRKLGGFNHEVMIGLPPFLSFLFSFLAERMFDIPWVNCLFFLVVMFVCLGEG